MKHYINSYMFTAICLTLIAFIGGFIWFINQAACNYPDTPDNIQAAIVLTGDELRIEKGIERLTKQESKNVFISGVGKGFNEDAFLKDKPCCIELGPRATNTVENVAESRQWLLDNNITSFALITSDYHMTRALYLFKAELGKDYYIYPQPVYHGQSLADKGRFRQLRLLSLEYLKYLYHIIDYEIIQQVNTP